ncbi:hypothetical protein PENTCL1PPCAC_9335, partial [Pristionchus entomophagus]
QATARNVANIMARLLKEIIESSRRDDTETAAPPAPPPSPAPVTESARPFLTTGLDEFQSATEIPMETTRSRVEAARTSEELQEILIANVDGEKMLSATIRHTENTDSNELTTPISITVTSVPLSIATTPPTEVNYSKETVNATSPMPMIINTAIEDAATSARITTKTESASNPAGSSTPFPTLIPQATTERSERKVLFTTRHFNPKVCEDNHSLCNVWSKYGECVKNPGYMYKYCRQSCGICSNRRRL